MSAADLPHDVGVLGTVPESLTARQSRAKSPLRSCAASRFTGRCGNWACGSVHRNELASSIQRFKSTRRIEKLLCANVAKRVERRRSQLSRNGTPLLQMGDKELAFVELLTALQDDGWTVHDEPGGPEGLAAWTGQEALRH